MAGSDISITTANGTGTVPIATLRDINQNVSPVHVVAVNVNGVTTQVSSATPMPVSIAAPIAVTQSGNWTISSQTSGQYNSTLPTLGNTQTGPLQTDQNGRLLISGSISASTSGQYNSTLPTLLSGQLGALQTDANGRLLTLTSPSESHLGEVGGNIAKFQAQFGPSSSTQYSAGICMSAPIEIPNAGRVAGGTGMMMGASLSLAAVNVQPVDLVFFTSQPGGTYTSGATFNPAPIDLPKLSKSFHLTDWTPLGSATLGEATPSGKFYNCDDRTKTQSLWVLPIARGNITLATTTDATLTLHMSRN